MYGAKQYLVSAVATAMMETGMLFAQHPTNTGPVDHRRPVPRAGQLDGR
jgi:hypothetical protein